MISVAFAPLAISYRKKVMDVVLSEVVMENGGLKVWLIV
jgi:hypothetical protein